MGSLFNTQLSVLFNCYTYIFLCNKNKTYLQIHSRGNISNLINDSRMNDSRKHIQV